MKIAIANPTAKTETIFKLVGISPNKKKITLPALSSPLRVWCNRHFPTRVTLCVVDIQLQLPSFVSFN